MSAFPRTTKPGSGTSKSETANPSVRFIGRFVSGHGFSHADRGLKKKWALQAAGKLILATLFGQALYQGHGHALYQGMTRLCIRA